MKVVAYCALHYGLPYFEWAIRSVIDHVDQFYVLYSPHGSHNGNRGTLPSIDSEVDLQAAALRGAGSKLVWIKGEWSHEGQQRDTIHEYTSDADVILVVDSDEVWSEKLVKYIFEDYIPSTAILGMPHPIITSDRFKRVPIIHYWRSFYRAVLHDPAYPERVLFPYSPNSHGGWDSSIGVINHFGYALPPEYIAYKWSGIHGHQAELRKDVDWLNDIYIANRQTDMHPVGSQYWNAERVDPYEFLPHWMKSHPYFHLEVIE